MIQDFSSIEERRSFESEIKTGRDADVKAWAEKCLPILREHLKLAQAAVEDVKKK